MTSCEPAMKPPQEASDFENVPIRRSTRSSTPSSSEVPAPRAPSTPAPWASSTISRAPWGSHSSTISGSGRDVALHREDAVDDDEHAAAVLGRALELLLELVEPVVAERAQLGAREQAAVEDRGVVAGVGDHRVAGREQRPERADVGLVAGGEDDRVLGAHPLGDLALELEVQRDRAVEQARAGQAGAVLLERVARALQHALVGGQPEVVVGAEHDPLGALHLDDRRGGPSSEAEVGQQVGLAGRAAARRARGRGPSRRRRWRSAYRVRSGWLANPVYVQPVASRRDLRDFIELPFRLHSSRHPVGAAAADRAPPLPQPPPQPVLQARRGASSSWPARDGRVVGRISAQIDHAYNRFHDDRWGWFGFLEFEDDPEIVPALLEAAERLAARARVRPMIGPDGLHDQRRERAS